LCLFGVEEVLEGKSDEGDSETSEKLEVTISTAAMTYLHTNGD